jgi:hypothetical protein
MGLHDVVLAMHNLFRWVVLVTAVVVLGRAAVVRRGHPWTETDTRWLRAFAGAFDVQLLLGLFMYFGTSALGLRMLQHADIAMKNSMLRFFAVEHIVGMVAAAAVFHIGKPRLRRMGEDPARQTKTAVLVAITLAIVFASIPWPFFPYGRPLIRLGTT